VWNQTDPRVLFSLIRLQTREEAWENHACAVYHTNACDKKKRIRWQTYVKVCFHDAHVVFVTEENVDKVRDRGKASVFGSKDNACINHPTRTTTRTTRTRLREPRMRCISHKRVWQIQSVPWKNVCQGLISWRTRLFCHGGGCWHSTWPWKSKRLRKQRQRLHQPSNENDYSYYTHTRAS
jgi:hypothetical protein